MFTLGFIGHDDALNIIQNVIDSHFNNVNVKFSEFAIDKDINITLDNFRKILTSCDGLLFEDYDIYYFISSKIEISIPFTYLAVDMYSFFSSILKWTLQSGIIPRYISHDYCEQPDTYAAIKEMCLDVNDIHFKCVQVPMFKENLIEYLYNEHLFNYNNGCQVCITNVQPVYIKLREINVPAVLIRHDKKLIEKTLKNLIVNSDVRISGRRDIALIKIITDLKKDFDFCMQFPLRDIDNHATLDKILTVWTEKLNGCIQKTSEKEHTIFCEEKVFLAETNNLSDFEYVKQISTETPFEVFIGVGFGHDFKAALKNCNMALIKSLKEIGSNIFVADSNANIIGPIVTHSYSNISTSMLDNSIAKIAMESGIGIQTLQNIHQVALLKIDKKFTSSELALHLNISQRSINRIIEVLLDAGYVQIVGKDLLSNKGRPHRIIKILF